MNLVHLTFSGLYSQLKQWHSGFPSSSMTRKSWTTAVGKKESRAEPGIELQARIALAQQKPSIMLRYSFYSSLILFHLILDGTGLKIRSRNTSLHILRLFLK